MSSDSESELWHDISRLAANSYLDTPFMTISANRSAKDMSKKRAKNKKRRDKKRSDAARSLAQKNHKKFTERQLDNFVSDNIIEKLSDEFAYWYREYTQDGHSNITQKSILCTSTMANMYEKNPIDYFEETLANFLHVTFLDSRVNTIVEEPDVNELKSQIPFSYTIGDLVKLKRSDGTWKCGQIVGVQEDDPTPEPQNQIIIDGKICWYNIAVQLDKDQERLVNKGQPYHRISGFAKVSERKVPPFLIIMIWILGYYIYKTGKSKTMDAKSIGFFLSEVFTKDAKQIPQLMQKAISDMKQLKSINYRGTPGNHIVEE